MFNPLLMIDFYKSTHHEQYPVGLTKMVSYYTPRMSRLKDVDKVTLFGLQAFIKEYLIEGFNDNFFNRPEEEVVAEYERVLNATLGPGAFQSEKIRDLHRLGYLPLEISAVPEGTRTAIGVPQIASNSPARIRMAVLYAIAAREHGRVANTCNRSEDFIGYSTKFGDAAGDFSVLSEYTVSEVRQIGKALGIPNEFIFKAPEDGLSGKTDEDNLGFTYDELDNFLLQGHYPSYDVYKNIEERHKRNLHKVKPMPSCPRYYSTRDWEV